MANLSAIKKKPMRSLAWIAVGGCIMCSLAPAAHGDRLPTRATDGSQFIKFSSPAGERPTTRQIPIDGLNGAILPNGRLLTPAGVEVNVDAPKPYGLALAPNGETLAAINSGASRFSVTLIRHIKRNAPTAQRIDVDATFMGLLFSPDGARFYASGGENGNIWVGDVAQGKIIGSVNLNGPAHPLDRPLKVASGPTERFKGVFAGNMVRSKDGRYLYVVDQAGFKVHVVDTAKIVTGIDGSGALVEPDNFAAVAGSVQVGRYPYGIAVSQDGQKLLVSHVGVFEFAHLMPDILTGDPNVDYPLCYPAVGYPDEVERDKTIKIKQVDPRNLPADLRDAEGIRCGYVDGTVEYTVPKLGSPNAPESSSVYVLDLSQAVRPALEKIVKTGPQVGEKEDGIAAYSGSHPNAIAVGPRAVYVANGNNDSISILHPRHFRELKRISLSFLPGPDRRLKGIQPVAVALSPDARYLYVAEAGINAVGVIALHGKSGRVVGHIPVGWWPSSIQVSPDGSTLYVANAQGRGAGPNIDEKSPKHSVMGTVNIIPVPSKDQLRALTRRVFANNGFTRNEAAASHENNPIPNQAGVPSKQIKHIVFINKENATYDLLLGDITQTRGGVPVNGEPAYSLGYDAAPNHHELALTFAFSDNFYLEPAVSSDGHRWLTNMYTTEFEQTHWPASYGGRRSDAGDDPAVFENYPGRLGFTDANGSPDPHDYNQHGGIYLHLARHNKPFVNFGNGYEFAMVDEDADTEPTGIRQHVNIPMEKVVRDHSDHLYPEYNTHIPDSPLPEDPQRFNRFSRFQQAFEAHYVDRDKGECKLPSYVDLYYPNDHGGGAFNINPNGPAWDFTRYVQDNDAALGLTVDLISHSPCWKDTVIFVVEDDPQNGLDHVDGYRSIFIAISPWVKREYLSKTHASLASLFKTVDLILGIPPLNQYDAAATDLRDMFTAEPDFTPYQFVALDYVRTANPLWAALTKTIDFSQPDREEVKLREAILKSEGLPRKTASQ